MPEGVAIRLATKAEYAAVGALTVDAYVDSGFIESEADYASALADAAGRARDSEVWVAAGTNGELLGTVTFCPPGSEQREVSADGEGEFRMLAVRSGGRRGGVARALVARCFERCRELGLHQLVMCSRTDMTAAHGLYAAMGFERDPRLDWETVEGVFLIGFRAAV